MGDMMDGIGMMELKIQGMGTMAMKLVAGTALRAWAIDRLFESDKSGSGDED